MLTIVMYHYVRDLAKTRYPGIKALETDQFSGQLDYIERNHTVCSAQQVIAASRDEDELPRNACFLTFDDGLLDHYVTVFPMLEKRGLTAGFFPPARAILERKLLDVHKIQLVLASVSDPRSLVTDVFELLGPHRSDHDIPTDAELWGLFAEAGKYDPQEVVLVKRLLQARLPEGVRNEIVDRLFERHVSVDEAVIAEEWYLDVTQLQCMSRHGMEIGGHGYSHRFLDTLPSGEQQAEIDHSRDLLKLVRGDDPVDWIMCYPAGSYNETTIRLLQESNCAIGLTADNGIVEDFRNPHSLRRLDTNDLPFFHEPGL